MTVLRHCKLLAALLLIVAPALCAAKDPGGEGFIKSQVFINNCFKTQSGTVTEVCADYRINWKMWSLMGEPVGDYNLGWQLNSITLMDPKRQQIVSFTPDTIPAELKNGVGRIELYVDGVATVRAANGSYGYHHFDTGTAVKAGGRSSVNSPGSPNWTKLFSTGGEACDDKQAAFMDAKKAKEAFISGIQLSDLKICPRSSVTELFALESAIAKLCKQPGADKQHRFCPEQKPEKKATEKNNSIDDAFANMEKQTGKTSVRKAGNIDSEFEKLESYRAEQERQRIAAQKAKQEKEARESGQKVRHDEAVRFCTDAMKSEHRCIEDACKRKPMEMICPPERGLRSCMPDAVVRNPEYSEWEACARSMASKCVRNGKQPTSLDACVAQRER